MQNKRVEIKVLCPDLFEECDECTRRLLDGLKVTRGVQDVSVGEGSHKVNLSYDAGTVSLDQIYEQARVLGASVNREYSHARIRVDGLDCPDCARKLETQIKRIDGVVWASLNFATSILIVEYKTEKVPIEEIYRRIRSLGYEVAKQQGISAAEPSRGIDRRLLATGISGAALAIGLLAEHLFHLGLPASVLYLISALAGAVYVARYGVLALIGRVLDTNFLMTIAAAGAIVLGEFAEAAAVMFLYSLGSALESVTTDKTRRSIYSLVQSIPKYAHLKTPEGIADVLLEDVAVGQSVIIKPGERIALDGIVSSGITDVNESSITGESLPVTKEVGSQVYAGSLNGAGSIEIVVSSVVSESTVSKVVKLVEDAQTQKAKSQSFSEVFGRIYTPIVVGAAVLTALIGPVITGGDISVWVHKALVLLVVACPCALVISTPVAIVAAIGHLASKGVLVRGGIHLETLGKVSAMGFDKTGTITTGKLLVEKVAASEGYTQQEVLRAAAAVEARSEHPIADAIMEHFNLTGESAPHSSYFKASVGKGATAFVQEGEFHVGNRRFMDEKGFDSSKIDVDSSGGSCVYVANEQEIMGLIVVNDSPRDEAAQTLQNLRNQGVSRIAMLTGDSRGAAERIGKMVGISEIYAELLPEDKLDVVKKLAAEDTTAVVGDGINDAPALAAAHVGIALKGLGNEAAVQSSDIVLMGESLSIIPYAVGLSRKARQVIFQNTAIALLTVGVLIVGTYVGVVGLAAGVIGHEGSALLVIANSMRLLSKKNFSRAKKANSTARR